jgi:mRNA interferase MazF
MRVGELWRYAPPSSPRRRVVVIVSSDGINDSARPWLIASDILSEDPEDILTVPVDGHGWVNAADLSRVYRPWLTEHVDTVDNATRERLDTALRAALDL